jgi:hypothetical protein
MTQIVSAHTSWKAIRALGTNAFWLMRPWLMPKNMLHVPERLPLSFSGTELKVGKSRQ